MDKQSRSFVKRRRFLKATGATVGVGMIAGCSSGGGNNNGSSSGGNGGGSSSSGGTTTGGSSSSGAKLKGSINVAGLLPLSGIYAQYGPLYRKGMNLAFEEYNNGDGVLGKKMNLLVADNADSGQKTVTHFRQFVQNKKAVAAVGPGGLAPTVQAAHFAEKNEVPIYTLAGIFPMFVNGDKTRYVFRPPVQGMRNWVRPQGSMAKENGYTNIGTIYQNGTLKSVFSQALKDFMPEGATVHSQSAPPTETNFSTYLRKMPKDLTMFVGTAHPAGAPKIYPQMYHLGFDPKRFTAGISPAQPTYKNVGKIVGRTFSPFTQVDITGDAYASVGKKYAAKYNAFFDTTAADGYVTAKLIAESIKKAGSADPTDIANASRNIKLDTLYVEPLQFTKWGTPDNAAVIFLGYDVNSSPSFYPKLPFKLTSVYKSDPMPGQTTKEMSKGAKG